MSLRDGQQQQQAMGGLLQSGNPFHTVQGEQCIEVKGGWWPIRFGEPPSHIALEQSPPITTSSKG